jgi:hypothetical protein
LFQVPSMRTAILFIRSSQQALNRRARANNAATQLLVYKPPLRF